MTIDARGIYDEQREARLHASLRLKQAATAVVPASLQWRFLVHFPTNAISRRLTCASRWKIEGLE